MRSSASRLCALTLGCVIAIAGLLGLNPSNKSDDYLVETMQPIIEDTASNTIQNPARITSQVKILAEITFNKELDTADARSKIISKEFPQTENLDEHVFIDEFDLNGDSVLEEFYYVIGATSCGTHNCALRIYMKGSADSATKILSVTAENRIFVLTSKTNGYHDLAFASTISNEPGYIIWHWNGIEYDVAR